MRANLQTSNIYMINPSDRSLDYRDPDSAIEPVNLNLNRNDLSLPFWATGIQRHDLAVFGSIFDNDGVSSMSYLVVRSSQNHGLLVPPNLVELDPKLQTRELAKKFATLLDYELGQLGINSLVNLIQKRFPGTKGL